MSTWLADDRPVHQSEVTEMERIGERAVVIGASMGGLLAAAAAAAAYEEVTVVDRDTLPEGIADRRAVPQGRHVHSLLPHGQDCIEELLPGLLDELEAAGAPVYRAMDEVRLVFDGHELARESLDNRAVVASRAFIEGHVRRRVRALPGVRILDRCDVVGLVATPDGSRVTGVRLLRRAPGSVEETLSADLVIAATGRGGRLPAWFEQLGYERPAEERLDVHLRYATRHLRRPHGTLGGDKLVLVGARPELPRILALFQQENDRWILTVGGYGDDHRPPSDPAGFDAYAAEVAPPAVREALRDAEPLDDPVTYGFPTEVRRRYDRLTRFPDGLLVVGDAMCSFNPVYGQGMTVAASEALALRRCLADGTSKLARRFFRASRPTVDDAWLLATGADLALPVVAGHRPASVRVMEPYLRRLRAVAAEDQKVATAFAMVVGMNERPPHVLRPAVALRVARGPRRRPGQDAAGELAVLGVRTPCRQTGPRDAREAVVFVHGNPGSSADFETLMRAMSPSVRAVAWDAPGFGRSAAPAGFRQDVRSHAQFIGAALDALGIDRVHLVAHDFGGPWALEWAAGAPSRVAGVTLLGTGVLLDYRWHALARIWRTPLAGEGFMATTTAPGFRLLLRRGNRRPLPRAFVDRMYGDFDRTTRRAVLDLYRAVDDPAGDAERLARALRPHDLPALVVWGRRDPYLPARLAERQREAFPSAEVHVVDDSGHWPLVDAADRVAELLTAFVAEHAGERAAVAA